MLSKREKSRDQLKWHSISAYASTPSRIGLDMILSNEDVDYTDAGPLLDPDSEYWGSLKIPSVQETL